MSRLLVRVRDREEHNPYRFGDGEVINVTEDSQVWSGFELNSPDLRIVELTVPIDDAERWLAVEQVDPEQYIQRRRHFKLVPEALNETDYEWYMDDTRKVPVKRIHAQEWEAAMRTRIPIPIDPVRSLNLE